MKISISKHLVFPLILALIWVGVFKITFDRQVADKTAGGAEEAAPQQTLAQNPLPERQQLQPRKTFSGAYLSSQFAQRNHDWKSAHDYMQTALKMSSGDNPVLTDLLTKRAMILGVGSGHHDSAFEIAGGLPADNQGSLALLFRAVKAFRDKDFTAAEQIVGSLPDGSVADFIMPLLASWAKASQGKFEIASLTQNNMHAYHAVQIAAYLKKEDRLPGLIRSLAANPGGQVQDLERLADAYTHIGEFEKAQALYDTIIEAAPAIERIHAKAEALKNGGKPDYFEVVQRPDQGIARALYDMAVVLYQDYSDESARVFANLALYLDPGIIDARTLLASVATRNKRYDEAIEHYKQVPVDAEHYMEGRLRIASLYEEMNRFEEARAELGRLATENGSIEALIQTGDMERRRKNFPDAIQTYGKAIEKLGGTVPEEHWNLLYARGIAYEQNGQWEQAEKDLQAALEYQPNDPYILNYLGYAWVDRGIHLDKSMDMIRRALSLEPNDGYITDSLGWAYYRLGQYAEAVPYLEKAAQLLPYDPVINDHLGDVYWKLGRKLEARFQWTRAKNHGEDTKLLASLADKLDNGLKESPVAIKEAASRIEAQGESKLADHP